MLPGGWGAWLLLLLAGGRPAKQGAGPLQARRGALAIIEHTLPLASKVATMVICVMIKPTLLVVARSWYFVGASTKS